MKHHQTLRRGLGALLSLLLCLTLLPAAALAADAVAEVNGTSYDSLAEAIAKAVDGDTVTLLKDVETEEKIEIKDKSLTLDLNKKTWTRTGTLLKIDSNANVTVKNGTMDFTVKTDSADKEADAIFLTAAAGSLTLEDVSIAVTNGFSGGGTTPGYAVKVFGGSLTIRGNREYGSLYVNFGGSAAVRLYGGSYTRIDLNGGTGSKLLDKGYIFVDANDKYVNVTNMKTLEGLRVIACTHEGEIMGNGYYSQCRAECSHVYDKNSGKCTECQQTLAVQVTDADDTSTKYYIHPADAFADAAAGSKVKLLRTVGAYITVSTPIKLYGNDHKITKLTVSGDVTLASLLPEGYAFKNENTWINDSDLSGKTSLDNVTTAEAPIRSVTPVSPTTSISLGEPVTLTANLIYPLEGNGQFQLTWYCNNTEAGKRTIGVNDISELGNYSLDQTPTAAGSYTYRLVFTRDGYSKSCTFTVKVTQTYTVTFDPAGGTMNGSGTATSNADGKVAAPFPPTRDGYFFTGWYLNEEKWDFDKNAVTKDITLTAKWAEKKYTVTAYGLYGGTMGITPGETYIANYAEGEPVGLQIGKQDGYTLDQSNPLKLKGITERDLHWEAKDKEVEIRGINFKMPANDVTITVNWVKNGSSSGSSGRSSGSSMTSTAINQIKNAKSGETVRIDMKGETRVPASVLNAAYGKNITLEFDMGSGAVWTVSGLDIPKGGVSLNLGIRTGTKSIPVKVINAITGEVSTVQLQLSHNGAFGLTLTLSLELGKAFDGMFANLYYYNETTGELDFQCSGKIRGGTASWPFTHASEYAVVIDEADHDPARFVDVASSAYYRDAVLWAAQKGITSGTDAAHFSPYAPCTRAQIVTFLWRAAGSPVVNYAMNMSDVPEDAYYAEAVRWALSLGITTGTSDTAFSPDAPCTRAQAVAFLFRCAAPDAVTLQELVSGFSDAASVPGYALPAMNWALAAGILQGSGQDLMPGSACTRAQIVTFLYRTYQGK